MLKDYQKGLENLGNIHVLELNNILTLRRCQMDVEYQGTLKDLYKVHVP
jgi:hypothetical protein